LALYVKTEWEHVLKGGKGKLEKTFLPRDFQRNKVEKGEPAAREEASWREGVAFQRALTLCKYGPPKKEVTRGGTAGKALTSLQRANPPHATFRGWTSEKIAE